MKAKIILFAYLILTILLFPQKIQAQEQASGSSATFSQILVTRETDNRAQILHEYLNRYNSPLAPFAGTFVAQADLYHLDWRLLVSISGVESTFGKEVPCVNAFGWGVYGDNMYCFNSYDEAISTISHDLRTKYINAWKADDVYAIGQIYSASPTWAQRVVYFMDDIQNFADAQNQNPLPISL